MAIGVAAGPVYDLFFCLRRLLRWKWVRIACDILFSIAFGGIYLAVAVECGFPSLRAFHLLGCLKSFHKMIAFFADKVYNRGRKTRKGRSRWTKEMQEETK